MWWSRSVQSAMAKVWLATLSKADSSLLSENARQRSFPISATGTGPNSEVGDCLSGRAKKQGEPI